MEGDKVIYDTYYQCNCFEYMGVYAKRKFYKREVIQR